ncbi:MAG: restriction endonuclease subunit R, partial [Alphaproteobacteria bacterium]|nr:restriction endonuclease subunit R [Alphaproteobacteria bacterium]
GCIVHNIDCTPGAEYIEFTGGRFLRHGEEIGSQTEDVMKIQVRETVEQHLKKELALRGRNIKVLSLFFIDRVANYRRYSRDDSPSPGRIAEWFEDAYRDLTARPLYRDLSPDALGHEISGMHDGYFSRDKKGHLKDSTERGSKDDEDAYNLIMRDKERLLDPKEPLRFIFSHSALREGWDNPNVFQICTLNETASAQKKRQEIGRGLRLCVNADGERVYDENINRLTVIANESYENFAATLQSEFEEDFGIRFGHIEQISFAGITREADGEDVPIGQEESRAIWNNLFVEGYIDADGAIQDKFDPDSLHFEFKIDAQHRDIESEIMDVVRNYIFKNRVADARKKVSVKFNKEVFLTPEFAALWEKIRHRTRYSVKFDTGELIASAVKGIMAMEKIRAPRVSVKRVGIDVLAAGVAAERVLEDKSQEVESGAALPDLLAYLQGETELTRHTLVEILRRSRRLGEFPVNPQQFMARVAREILRALQGLMLKGIQYEKIDRFWEMSRIEADAERDITHYLNRLHRVQNARKCIYDAIEVDSRIEREFARDLDNNEHVRLFVKLPRWFKVDTPIGPYNPDWAFMTECDERLYFVRETKSTTNSDKQRKAEKQKTDCGAKHFKAINVDYDVVTSLSKVDLCKQ